MRSVTNTIPPSMGTDPPAVPVPRPRVVTGTRNRAAARMTSTTSAWLSGNTTSPGA